MQRREFIAGTAATALVPSGDGLTDSLDRRHGSVLAPLSLGAPRRRRRRATRDRGQRPLPFDGIAAAPRADPARARRSESSRRRRRSPVLLRGGMRPQQRWAGKVFEPVWATASWVRT